MNEIINKNENSISFYNGFRKLRSSQKDFYNILVEKIKNNENISYSEMEIFYFEKVAKNKDKMYWCYYKNVERDDNGNFVKFIGGYKPLEPWQIEMRVKDWTIRTIGILVIKGYLKILPVIDFNNNIKIGG